MTEPNSPRRDVPRKPGKATIITQIMIGLGVGLVANLIFGSFSRHLADIYDWARYHSFYLGMPFVILTVLLTGAVAYWIRGRYPMVYGATEVVVGVVGAVNALARSDITSIKVDVDPTVIIQFLGGVYIIVRGLDNFGKGVRATSLEAPWKRVFPQI
jgi:hypothetical protein